MSSQSDKAGSFISAGSSCSLPGVDPGGGAQGARVLPKAPSNFYKHNTTSSCTILQVDGHYGLLCSFQETRFIRPVLFYHLMR